MQKLKQIIKRNEAISKFAEKLIDSCISIYDNTVNRFFWNIFSFRPINNSKIIISSYYGRGFSDNAKYIVEELLRRNNKYDIVWIVNDLGEQKNFPDGVRVVKYKSIKSIYEYATSKVWIDNSRKQCYTKKRSQQLYIQTWHGGIALKKIENDAKEALRKSYIKFAQKDSKNADLFISNSRFNTEMYRRAFWYDGDILECGVPRNDLFFNNVDKTIEKVKKSFDIEDKKIILYAPTFRKENNLEVYKFDYERCINKFEEKFGSEFVMLIRLHPNVFHRSTELNFDSKKVLNASFYPDMQELLVATDILITDYSSSMFDFILTQKPCFIYASDIKDYRDDRGFYFDLEKLPFSISASTNDMLKNIEDFNYQKYKKHIDEFLAEQGCVDEGNASKKVADWIESNA